MEAMKKRLRITLLITLMSLFSLGLEAGQECFPEDILPDKLFPSVRIETSMGDIVVELNRLRAPATSNNFLRYVLEKQYDGTIFHRVMADFVVQGGGYSEDLEERDLHSPVINESGNGIPLPASSISTCRQTVHSIRMPGIGVTRCLVMLSRDRMSYLLSPGWRRNTTRIWMLPTCQ
jgi:peptidyl-prolyl cis-trans isomerase A (cyclophilin A)